MFSLYQLFHDISICQIVSCNWFVLEKEFGRPWHTYEAYQKVIKKQVKTLIAMGADPALKVSSTCTVNSEIVNYLNK